MFNFFFRLIHSISVLEEKEPRRNERINAMIVNPAIHCMSYMSFIIVVKCPVTLVVRICRPIKPVMFTNPAMKDRKTAILTLCFSVLVLPWWRNIWWDLCLKVAQMYRIMVASVLNYLIKYSRNVINRCQELYGKKIRRITEWQQCNRVSGMLMRLK